jgi:hypothetical protein
MPNRLSAATGAGTVGWTGGALQHGGPRPTAAGEYLLLVLAKFDQGAVNYAFYVELH